MNTRPVTMLALSVLLAACGDDGGKDGHEISQSALTGTIAGQAFEAKGGYAADLFGDGEYWVELHATEIEDPCSRSYPVGPHIILSATPDPADAPLGLQNNITFAHGDAENDVATTGRLVLDGVSGDRLTGGLFATMGEHEVDGTFDVPVCPNE